MLDKPPRPADDGDLCHQQFQNIVHAAVVSLIFTNPHRRADEI